MFSSTIFGLSPPVSPRGKDQSSRPVTMSSDPNADKHPTTVEKAGAKDVSELQDKLDTLGVRCAGPLALLCRSSRSDGRQARNRAPRHSRAHATHEARQLL